MPKYKKGDIVRLADRNGVQGKVVVVCGLCANGIYSTLPMDEYIVALSWAKDPSESPARGRVAVEYLDKTATFLGADLAAVQVIYGPN